MVVIIKEKKKEDERKETLRDVKKGLLNLVIGKTLTVYKEAIFGLIWGKAGVDGYWVGKEKKECRVQKVVILLYFHFVVDVVAGT
jgi:hypothetical protein